MRRLVLVLLVAGCRYVGGGLDGARPGPDPLPFAEDAMREEQQRDDARRADAFTLTEPAGVSGLPSVVGCADGTREGFRDLGSWPDIAGCSGGWSVPGLLDDDARAPRCGRGSGNSSDNPAGAGCSVSDLCAEGWHACRGGADVARSSLSRCESAVGADERLFFVALQGASPLGLCSDDATATNDLHGCGRGIGEADGVGCDPLDRRMGFAECLRTRGIWMCGGSVEAWQEAATVVKTSPFLGGVLCCRDP